jgi:hypothetical protein
MGKKEISLCARALDLSSIEFINLQHLLADTQRKVIAIFHPTLVPRSEGFILVSKLTCSHELFENRAMRYAIALVRSLDTRNT